MVFWLHTLKWLSFINYGKLGKMNKKKERYDLSGKFNYKPVPGDVNGAFLKTTVDNRNTQR